MAHAGLLEQCIRVIGALGGGLGDHGGVVDLVHAVAGQCEQVQSRGVGRRALLVLRMLLSSAGRLGPCLDTIDPQAT